MSNWTLKKVIGLFASGAFLILILFNKSEWKIRFLDWGAGAIVVALMMLFFLLRGRVNYRELFVIIAPLIWVGYALLATPFAHNISNHFTVLVQVSIITFMCSCLVLGLFTHAKLMEQTIILASILWTIINLMLLGLWHIGILTYEKRYFSGLFENRNEFAVQTVILLGMLLLFIQARVFLKLIAILLSFVLVLSSFSLKGFFFFFFVIFFPFYLKSNFRKKNIVALAAVLVFGATYAYMPYIQERITRLSMVFTNPYDLRQSESAFLRSWLIVEGGKLIVEKPITGVGVDNARFLLIPQYVLERGDGEGIYSHNNYIEMGLNAGLVGIFLYYFPLLYIYKKTSKNHPYWVPIRTFIVLYMLLGIAMVQYDNFISIFLYCLIIFLYIFYKGIVNLVSVHRPAVVGKPR